MKKERKEKIIRKRKKENVKKKLECIGQNVEHKLRSLDGKTRRCISREESEFHACRSSSSSSSISFSSSFSSSSSSSFHHHRRVSPSTCAYSCLFICCICKRNTRTPFHRLIVRGLRARVSTFAVSLNLTIARALCDNKNRSRLFSLAM